FRQYRQLSTDGAVTDDAQLLAADLEGVGGALQPAATVGNGVLLGNAAQQQNGFGQHQFGNRTGIGIRRIEYRHTHFTSRVEINLVGANAETADGYQFACVLEHVCSQLCTGTDTNEVRVSDRFLELFFRQRASVIIDI